MIDLRIGVIGSWGRGRLAEHADQPGKGSRIVAGMDAIPENLAKFKELHGDAVHTYTDYNQMLDTEQLDAVFVASPDYCHEEQAVAVLERGIPLYLEKPMAITIKGCDRILKTARARTAKLFMGHNMRYMAFIQKMKALIDSGTIGEVKAVWCRHFVAYGGDAYFRDWHAARKNTTSLLLQKATHDIDVIHWLVGSFSTHVSGVGSLGVYNRCSRRDPSEKGNASFNDAHWPPLNQSGFSPDMDVEDHSMIMMRMRNGVEASYMQCHYTPDAWRNYTIIGTAGRIENYGEDTGTIEVWTKRAGYRLHGDQSLPVEQEAGSHGGADPKIVQSFLSYVRGKERPLSSPQASRYSVAVGCKAAESIRGGGGFLKIPQLSDNLEKHIF